VLFIASRGNAHNIAYTEGEATLPPKSY